MWTLGVIALLGYGIWLVRQLATRAHGVQHAWPVLARALLTEREKNCYRRLRRLYPEKIVLTQVALSQLLEVRPGIRDARGIQNRYFRLVADFVICESDFRVLAVVELDDLSHARADRQDADRRKNMALEAAGLRLIRISPGPLPSDDELRQLIEVGMPSPDGPVLPKAPPRWRVAVGESPLIGPLVGVGLLVILGVGWSFYSRAIISGSANFFATSLAAIPPTTKPAAGDEAGPPRSTVAAQKESERLGAQRASAVQALAEQQAAAALALQKEQAWSAYYAPSPSCEHPPNWSEQVECGNRYMRAKKQFESQWAAQHELVTVEQAATLKGP